MKGQRDKARAGGSFGSAKDDQTRFDLSLEPDAEDLKKRKDEFVGYDVTDAATQVLALWDEQKVSKEALGAGETGYVALARTPFYLEAGGQVSDTGRIFSEATGASATVEGLVRVLPGLPRAHRVRMISGTVHVRDIVTAEVDAEARNATRRNHTATHLLHA